MVNTYNHQLKQKYIYDLAAFHVQAESMMRGYQMKTPVAPKGSMVIFRGYFIDELSG